jgi:hypothetical protein
MFEVILKTHPKVVQHALRLASFASLKRDSAIIGASIAGMKPICCRQHYCGGGVAQVKIFALNVGAGGFAVAFSG